jgi:hypothetical protein
MRGCGVVVPGKRLEAAEVVEQARIIGVVRHSGRDQLGGLVVLAGFGMRPRGEPQLPG